MAILQAFCKTVTTINRWLAIIVSSLVFVMVSAISYEVVARYFFDAPTVWALELSTLLLGPYFMLAGPYMLHVGAHVNVDILYVRLPPRIAAIVDCVTFPIIGAFCLIVIAQSWPVAINAFNSGETSFSAWNPPIWPVKMIIPAAFFLLFLQAFAEWMWALRRTFGRTSGESFS